VPVTTVVSSPPSRVSWMLGVSTGCGLTSTNAWYPSASRVRTAEVSSTVRLRLPYQYAASCSVPSVQVPVTVESIGTVAGSGVTGASSSSNRSRMSSTWTEWEA
jgi:hypothetical protein